MTSPHRFGLVWIAILLAAATAGLPRAIAQESSFTLEGKVVRLEGNKFTVGTEDNIVFHVRYTDKTEFRRADGSEGSAKDLRVGVFVHVLGDLAESGEITATKITLSAPPKKS